MTIGNKVVVTFFADKWDSFANIEMGWQPINFAIYSDRFPKLIREAFKKWWDEHETSINASYEIIFVHRLEHDKSGALTREYFEPIYMEVEKI